MLEKVEKAIAKAFSRNGLDIESDLGKVNYIVHMHPEDARELYDEMLEVVGGTWYSLTEFCSQSAIRMDPSGTRGSVVVEFLPGSPPKIGGGP